MRIKRLEEPAEERVGKHPFSPLQYQPLNCSTYSTPTPSSFPFYLCPFLVVPSRGPWGSGFWVGSLGFGSWEFAPLGCQGGVLSVPGALQGVFLCLFWCRVSLFISVVFPFTLHFCWVHPPPVPVSLHVVHCSLSAVGGLFFRSQFFLFSIVRLLLFSSVALGPLVSSAEVTDKKDVSLPGWIFFLFGFLLLFLFLRSYS